jgi:L-lysine exporter family protein LysE/ArgO
LHALIVGFALTISLIAAIGLQNLFVIKQGLSNQRPFFSAFSCFLCDIVMISMGIFAIGLATHYVKALEPLMIYAGLLFLLAYGGAAIYKSLRPMGELNGQNPSEKKQASRKKILLVAIAFSFLNPQAYIDTFIILGGRASHFKSLFDTELFALGCLLASFIWFFSLSFTARLGSGWFQKPIAWRLLSLFSGLTMLYCAYLLATMLGK